MAEGTAIEWADHTFNGWEGCQKVGPGCDHCYAETRNARFGGGVAPNWGPGAPRRRTSPQNWTKPKVWNAAAASFAEANGGRRQRVFCASLADVFDNAVDPAWREDLFELIRLTPNLDWLLLTKRIGNVVDMVRNHGAIAGNGTRYLPGNVWLGATVVNQQEADRDVPKLLATKRDLGARVAFLSMEPLLGSVDLTILEPGSSLLNALTGDSINMIGDNPPRKGPAIDWVIVGGESGPGARPMHPDWAHSLRDQCADAGVPFLFKQWGEWQPCAYMGESSSVYAHGHHYTGAQLLVEQGQGYIRAGKKLAGRKLYGRTHTEFPKE
jgi:protein gp37